MSADGDIVTHRHVAAGADQITVFRGGGEKLTIVTLGELTDQRVGAHVTKTVETAGG